MADVDRLPPPRLPGQAADRCSLLQRALACELAGRLNCALALIRRARDLDPTGSGPATPTAC